MEAGVYILQITRILFPGRTDHVRKIFAIEGNPTSPLINIFYCIFRSLWSQNLEKYVKFCENSQSTNILPQIWLKVQILFPPLPGIFEENVPLPAQPQLVTTHSFDLLQRKIKTLFRDLWPEHPEACVHSVEFAVWKDRKMDYSMQCFLQVDVVYWTRKVWPSFKSGWGRYSWSVAEKLFYVTNYCSQNRKPFCTIKIRSQTNPE